MGGPSGRSARDRGCRLLATDDDRASAVESFPEQRDPECVETRRVEEVGVGQLRADPRWLVSLDSFGDVFPCPLL